MQAERHSCDWQIYVSHKGLPQDWPQAFAAVQICRYKGLHPCDERRVLTVLKRRGHVAALKIAQVNRLCDLLMVA